MSRFEGYKTRGTPESLKGTVSRDFMPQVFFSEVHFRFFSKLCGGIRSSRYTTDITRGKFATGVVGNGGAP